MKLAARIQACIDILIAYQANKGPFDDYISVYFRNRRYIGSSDRRYIQNLCFNILRKYFFLNYNIDDKHNKYYLMVMRYLVHYDFYKIAELNQLNKSCKNAFQFKEIDNQDALLINHLSSPSEQSGLSRFLEAHLGKRYTVQELQQLSEKAPFDLRINLTKISRQTIINQFQNLNFDCQETPHSPIGIRFYQRFKLENSPNYTVQDEGSQLLCKIVSPRAGELIMDYCAGAGGKSLALADLSLDRANIHAYDAAPSKLLELKRRATLAQFNSIKVLSVSDLNLTKTLYDKIVVDVPCSGTGTLRRSPDRKLWLTLKQLDRFRTLQMEILDEVVPKLKSGGILYYFTCSLLPAENEEQIKDFLTMNPNFKPVDPNYYRNLLPCISFENNTVGITLTPWQTGTDGFYSSILIKS